MIPKISIIILNYNGWRDTIECLESVLRSNYENYQVIVTDNNSPNKSMDHILAWAEGGLKVSVNEDNPLRSLSDPPVAKPVSYIYYGKEQAEKGGEPAREKQLEDSLAAGGNLPVRYPLILIQTGSNLGFAGGNNVGIRYALSRDFDYVFLLNNDAVVTQNALNEIVADALKNPQAGMVAPRVFKYRNPDVIDRLGLVIAKSGFACDRQQDDDGPLLCPSGCAALYSRAMLSAIVCEGQYFDEDFFMFCEDSDLGLRAQLKGFNAVLSENAVVFHKGGGSPGTYFLHRNTIWAIIKNFPLKLLLKNSLWILMVQIGGLIKALNSTRRDAVLKGKADGIRGIRKMWAKRYKCNGYNLPIDKRPFIRHSQANTKNESGEKL